MSDANVGSGTTSFVPHPNAHAAAWSVLLRPVKEAVRELLVKLDGATHRALQEATPYANCFLVHGDRGTGKTTVLINSQDLVQKKSLEQKQGHDSSNMDADFVIARDCARALNNRDVIWLDILDLEPVPPRANLLTLLLTRVRDACESSAGGSARRNTCEETTHLFPNRDCDADSRIRQLIGDASLMWEEITETDTRSVASRRESSAALYTRFRDKFADAMNAFTAERYRRRNAGDGNSLFILPIDNIDRSPEHLAAMVKLASLVSCRYFWLILAGERGDLETFLERSYWKDLIRVGDGAVGSGKFDRHGEDETFAMARRQAAASLQKLLPYSHRIEVKRVKPEETLKFKLDQRGLEIQELLSRLALIEKPSTNGTAAENDEKPRTSPVADKGDRSLLNLLELKGKPTEAGKMALTLPARDVIDLWQLAESEQQSASRGEPAIKLARTMLRQVISRSMISSNLGIQLQDHIIDRKLDQGTVLNFKKRLMVIERLGEPLYEIEMSVQENRRSTLRYRNMERIILRIRLPHCGNSPRDVESPPDDEDLPDDVAGWMAVLHDLVVWSKTSFVANLDIPTAPFVTVRHVMPSPKSCPLEDLQRETSGAAGKSSDKRASPLKLQLTWPAPRWDAFAAHDFFRQKWTELQEEIANAQGKKPAWDRDLVLRKLVMGWINCSLHTFDWGARLLGISEHELWPDGCSLQSNADLCAQPTRHEMSDAKDPEVLVIELLEKLYGHLKCVADRPSSPNNACENSWLLLMKDWLEWELPRLRTTQLVPRSFSSEGQEVWRSFDEMWESKARQLVRRWTETQQLINAEAEIRHAPKQSAAWRRFAELP